MDPSMQIQIQIAKKRAEEFSKSLLEARRQEASALKALEDEREKWSQSFEEKSVMIEQLERELEATVSALHSEQSSKFAFQSSQNKSTYQGLKYNEEEEEGSYFQTHLNHSDHKSFEENPNNLLNLVSKVDNLMVEVQKKSIMIEKLTQDNVTMSETIRHNSEKLQQFENEMVELLRKNENRLQQIESLETQLHSVRIERDYLLKELQHLTSGSLQSSPVKQSHSYSTQDDSVNPSVISGLANQSQNKVDSSSTTTTFQKKLIDDKKELREVYRSYININSDPRSISDDDIINYIPSQGLSELLNNSSTLSTSYQKMPSSIINSEKSEMLSGSNCTIPISIQEKTKRRIEDAMSLVSNFRREKERNYNEIQKSLSVPDSMTSNEYGKQQSLQHDHNIHNLDLEGNAIPSAHITNSDNKKSENEASNLPTDKPIIKKTTKKKKRKLIKKSILPSNDDLKLGDAKSNSALLSISSRLSRELLISLKSQLSKIAVRNDQRVISSYKSVHKQNHEDQVKNRSTGKIYDKPTLSQLLRRPSPTPSVNSHRPQRSASSHTLNSDTKLHSERSHSLTSSNPKRKENDVKDLNSQPYNKLSDTYSSNMQLYAPSYIKNGTMTKLSSKETKSSLHAKSPAVHTKKPPTLYTILPIQSNNVSRATLSVADDSKKELSFIKGSRYRTTDRSRSSSSKRSLVNTQLKQLTKEIIGSKTDEHHLPTRTQSVLKTRPEFSLSSAH